MDVPADSVITHCILAMFEGFLELAAGR
jgi:hypothetical protein